MWKKAPRHGRDVAIIKYVWLCLPDKKSQMEVMSKLWKIKYLFKMTTHTVAENLQ